ncbi:Selenoprotein T2 [Collichthys lucidus]|uniref:Selenoprotein T n=1 Tax=Collichthys lucidus TaxID=240159 RepID=A0A4U5TX89_COLLU|nr:Selenoprotein T2 [Collichthys lucidus]
MAEYSQVGLLAALLLFTALTVRDVYLGRSSPHRGQQPADGPSLSPDTVLPDTEPGKPAKSSLYTGPVLKFQYWCVGNLVSYLKLLSILLIISGQNPFILLGLDTPRAWAWSQDNKIFSCLMAFLCNMMETHFLSTGAFEVTLNDVPLWSKLQSGYVPNIQEIFQILDNHLKINQVDPMSFTSS